MKRYWFLIMLILILVNVKAYSKTDISIVVGATADKIYFDQLELRKITLYHFGYRFGVTASVDLHRKWFVDPTLSYCTTGLRFDNSSYGLEPTRWNINSITLQLPIEKRIGKNFGIQFGPQVSYMISVWQYGNGNEGDISDAFNRIDAAVLAGVVFHAEESIYLAFHYIHGLLDLNHNIPFTNSSTPEVYYFPKEYSRSFALTVGWMFSHKKNKPVSTIDK